MWSIRSLDYDSRVVNQKLNLEIGRGEWMIGGFMSKAEVGSQCDTLATSIIVVLLDDSLNFRWLVYSHIVKRKLVPMESKDIVEIDRAWPFRRSLSGDIKGYWGAKVESWRIVGIELRVEFWMQLGIVNKDAAKLAQAAGMEVVMDRCMWIEHARLIKG